MQQVMMDGLMPKLLDIQHLASLKAGRRLQVQELATLFGYQGASGITAWMGGTTDRVYSETAERIEALWRVCKGEQEWLQGLKWEKGIAARAHNTQVMRAWHAQNWERVKAELAAKEKELKDRLKAAEGGYSLKHVLVGLDQTGEQLDRMERKLEQLGLAVGKLLVLWDAQGGDGGASGS